MPSGLRRLVLPLARRDDHTLVIRQRPCRASATSAGADSHPSNSALLRRITGMAFGWIGDTTAFASVVRKPNRWCSPSTGLALVPRVPCQVVRA